MANMPEMTSDAAPDPVTAPVCQCTDVCVIPQGQPQPIASCRGLERQATQSEHDAYCVGQSVGWGAAVKALRDSDTVHCVGGKGPSNAWLGAADWLAAHRPTEMTPTPELMARATQAAPVQRLYDALAAMMYGWEDDAVRLEGFAALKAAADWLAAGPEGPALDIPEPTLSLVGRIREAINSVSAENGSDTPDFILAQFLIGCLNVFDNAVRKREDWYGRGTMTPTPELMARATQAVLAIIGVDDRVGPGARQAVVSPATHKLAADIAKAVIEAITFK